jgi:hypothetical protein
MRVLVCGGRNYNDSECVSQYLYRLKPTVVIQGGASGADRLAGEWAKHNNVHQEIYPADWNRLGRAAGPIRNQQMLDEGKPDVVLAFDGGRGTADMVRRAGEAGINIIRARGA